MSYDQDSRLRKLEPLIGKDACTRLWIALKMGSRHTRQAADFKINQLCQQLLEHTYREEKVLLVPPPSQVCSGPIDAGEVWYDGPRGRLGLCREEVNRHVGIVGASGSGKTTFAFKLVKSILEDGIPCVVFDVKRSWRSLQTIVPKEDIRIYTLARPDVSPLRMNFLREPDGIDPLLFDQITTSIMDETLYGGLGSHSVSKMITARLRSRMDEYTVLDMFRESQSMTREMGNRKRAGDWFSTAQRILSELCSPPLGYVINWTGNEFESELQDAKLVIFECDLITHYQFTFFVTSFLVREYLKRIGTKKRDELEKVVIFEEAGRIFNQPFPQPTFETVLRECREVGLGICWINQSAGDVSRTAWSNTNTLAIFKQVSSSDINAVAAAVAFEQPREKAYIARLPVGECIMRLPDRYPFPFLMRTEDVPKAVVSDEEVHEMAVENLSRAGIPFRRKVEIEPIPISVDKKREEHKTERPTGPQGAPARRLASSLEFTSGGALGRQVGPGVPARLPSRLPEPTRPYGFASKAEEYKACQAHLLAQLTSEPDRPITYVYSSLGLSKAKGSKIKKGPSGF